MSKDENIIVRVDLALKKRIEDAAKRRGLSVTGFVLEAAEKAARKVEAMPVADATIRVGSGACPTFFKAIIATAGQGGGNVGYITAGCELARHLGDLIDCGDAVDGQGKLDELNALIGAGDDAGGFAWFGRELPRCAEMIPARRRARFIEGVRRRIDQDGPLMM